MALSFVSSGGSTNKAKDAAASNHPATMATAMVTRQRDSSRNLISLCLLFAGFQSNAVRPAVGSRDDTNRSKSFDIAHWWLPEEAAIFTIKLANAFIANFVSCARGIHPIHEHPLPRPL